MEVPGSEAGGAVESIFSNMWSTLISESSQLLEIDNKKRLKLQLQQGMFWISTPSAWKSGRRSLLLIHPTNKTPQLCLVREINITRAFKLSFERPLGWEFKVSKIKSKWWWWWWQGGKRLENTCSNMLSRLTSEVMEKEVMRSSVQLCKRMFSMTDLRGWFHEFPGAGKRSWNFNSNCLEVCLEAGPAATERMGFHFSCFIQCLKTGRSLPQINPTPPKKS